MHLIFTLIAVIGVATGVVSRAAPEEIDIGANELLETQKNEFKESFDKIDEYLVKNVENDRPEANIEAAKKWLNIQMLENKEQNLVKALEIFVSLETAASKAVCDRNSLDILMKNDEATVGRALAPLENTREQRRIEKVIEFYAAKHADSCMALVEKCQVCRRNQSQKKQDVNQVRQPNERLVEGQSVMGSKLNKSHSRKLKSFFMKLVTKRRSKKLPEEENLGTEAKESESGKRDKKHHHHNGGSSGDNNNKQGSFLDNLIRFEALKEFFGSIGECLGACCCGYCEILKYEPRWR